MEKAQCDWQMSLTDGCWRARHLRGGCLRSRWPSGRGIRGVFCCGIISGWNTATGRSVLETVTGSQDGNCGLGTVPAEAWRQRSASWDSDSRQKPQKCAPPKYSLFKEEGPRVIIMSSFGVPPHSELEQEEEFAAGELPEAPAYLRPGHLGQGAGNPATRRGIKGRKWRQESELGMISI